MFDFSNNYTWVPGKVSLKFPSADVTCMARPVLNAAWHETPTVRGMDTHAPDMSRHLRGGTERKWDAAVQLFHLCGFTKCCRKWCSHLYTSLYKKNKQHKPKGRTHILITKENMWIFVYICVLQIIGYIQTYMDEFEVYVMKLKQYENVNI